MSDLPTNPVAVPERLLKPVNKRVMAGLLVFFVLFMVIPAVAFLWMGLTPGGTVMERSLYGAMALVLLALPARLMWVSARRQIRTGRWGASDEERIESRRRWAAYDRTKGVMSWLDPLMVVLWVGLLANSVWGLWHRSGHGWWDVVFAVICGVNVFLFGRTAVKGMGRKTA